MSDDPIPEAPQSEAPELEQRIDPPAETPPRKRRSMAVVLLLGASALAFATAWFDPMNWRGESDLPALRAEISVLNEALAGSKAAQADLETRLTALEGKPAPPTASPEAVAALEKRLAEAEAALQALAAAPANADGSIPAASFAALQAAVEALKTDLAAMGTTTGGVSPEAVQAAVDVAMADWMAGEAAKAQAEIDAERDKAARAKAVEAIRAAFLSGMPYAESLPALAGTDIPAVLKDHAETGLPTLTSLAADFPDAARKALDAALREASDDPSLTGRLLGFLRVQSGARSLEPREGNDPDAVLSRAEAAVKAGDVALALRELSGLPPAGLAEMTVWSDKAGLYLSAEKAIAELSAAVGP